MNENNKALLIPTEFNPRLNFGTEYNDIVGLIMDPIV